MKTKNIIKENDKSVYDCWLGYGNNSCKDIIEEYRDFCGCVVFNNESPIVNTAANELKAAINSLTGAEAVLCKECNSSAYIFMGILNDENINKFDLNVEYKLSNEGFIIKVIKKDNKKVLAILGKDEKGILYGVFSLIRSICSNKHLIEAEIVDNPKNEIRMIDHWDNMSGDIERGYAGKSIFYKDNVIFEDMSRIRDYARILASVGINSVAINNVNVHQVETKLITDEYLPQVDKIADIFRNYGVKLYLSINFASPIEIGGLATADPYDEGVKNWWKETAAKIYGYIPDFGGFLVKADSEFRPGPFTYGRNHADGANMLAEALESYGGLVIWRCFVYNCLLDWRDRSKDRARAAYDHFKPLDGKFKDNVILQVKNGPMDFQIREAVSPLFGAMEKTNQVMEFQIAQEYTGQQKHLCYLIPMWKEVLEFDTFAKGEGSTVSKVVDGTMFNRKHGGITAVSNIGDSKCWTGHPLAQANLYGFGRLAWNPELTSKEIAEEWVKLTFGCDEDILNAVVPMLLQSREVYEEYTSPLGIGWMVNPNHHYGPSVDGYEYQAWGTYHYADFKGFGVDRTVATGTGYTAQYKEPVAKMYENIETCPENLLLFFHHVPYTYELKTGKTVIQHIYDTHFEGVEQVENMIEKWNALKEKVSEEEFSLVSERFNIQLRDSKEWRDVVNTYFYRRTGIKDIHGRKIYE